MKILIIDDDNDFLVLCKQQLEKLNDTINITTSIDPKKVIFNIFKEELNKFDAIISDYRMNVIDGVLINKYLKSKLITTPFVLISSSEYTEIRKNYSYQICDYFVQKKLIISEFCQEILKCLSQISMHHEVSNSGLQAIFSNNVYYVRN